MNPTEIKTRHGLILQDLTARALNIAGYKFIENPKYDEISEIPDFLIPDADSPRFMIEVHQTDARDSFRMKILRGFTAVTESKVFYTDDLVCVNILFGDPAREVPESNFKALCGYFDVNIIPRYDARNRPVVEKLERLSLELAGTEDITVKEAAKQIAEEIPESLEELSETIGKALNNGNANPILKDLWQLERNRTKRLGPPPEPGERSYYKRNILRSLFFSDRQFKELIDKDDPSEYSQPLTKQLVLCKLADVQEQIWGDEVVIDAEFEAFLKDPDAPRLRQLCQQRLNDNEAMKWFFEDIKDEKRRLKMCNTYIRLRNDKLQNISKLISLNLESDSFHGINHRRCWIVDILARDLGVSHNLLNREMVQEGFDLENLGNPFNQLSYKSSRFMGRRNTHSIYCEGLQNVVQKIVRENGIILEEDPSILSNRLLSLRLDGVIKLQKLNPLFLVIESICALKELSFLDVKTESIISDLAKAARSVGKFNLFHITDGRKNVIANAVAVIDQNGDHKSKEWGARRRAIGYRYQDRKVRAAEFDEAVFIIDGDWEKKHVERLHRAGWTRIIRLDQVEDTFREIFNITSDKEIQIPEEPLPLAAEDDDDTLNLDP